MTTPERLLSFEISQDGNELEIHCDETGVRDLLAIVQRVLTSRDHEHLMMPAWGGNELTEVKQGQNTNVVKKVTIRFWK